MIHSAKITTESNNSREVCSSINVDNVSMKDLSIETGFDEKTVTTVIKSSSIKTMLNTIDDLLRCQIAAESMIKK